MRFLFVTKIDEIIGNKIVGQISFSPREPWRYPSAHGEMISVSVISEAIGQLVSWLSLSRTNYFGRPVFLFATDIELSAGVPVGATVRLEAEISNENPDSFMFSGRAEYDGQTVAKISDCGGYLMPLAELEDPEMTRGRFGNIMSGIGPEGVEGSPFDLSSLVDAVDSIEKGQKIVISKRFREDEPFFADHFPRFPVTPIVVINEMIGRAASIMMSGTQTHPATLVPVSVRDLKIRSFIRPGDTVQVSVKKIEMASNKFETVAEIMVGTRRILRGRFSYDLMEGL